MNPIAQAPDAERSRPRRRWFHAALAVTMVVGGIALSRVTAEATSPQTCGGKQATVTGTAKNDVLVGTRAADVIWGGPGRDRIYGLGGNDIVCGGDGNDVIVGGDGDDWVDAGPGADRVYGEAGWDVCRNGELVRRCEMLTAASSGPTTTSTTATTMAPTTMAPTTAPPAPPPTSAPGPTGTPPGIAVDESRIPAPAAGVSGPRIGPQQYGTSYNDGVGAFRINCFYSHMNFDDPIVAPGQSRATHLHVFFGNTGVNASSTSQSIASSGNSTCSGGTLNRTAYWAPAMIDTATGTPLVPNGGHGLQTYYKTGYQGVHTSQVVNFPAGLRIIAGDARRTTAPGSASAPHVAVYHCGVSGPIQLSIPSCAPGQELIMSVLFPQCWDGRNLDSADHRSHMAYGTWGPVYGQNGAGCPASHPVPLPQITMNMRYLVGPGGTSTWRLSSDTYSGPAGYSGHADWWNGWDAGTFQRVINNCYSTGIDCQMNLLGDGQQLLM
jgi:hypothetical protein